MEMFEEELGQDCFRNDSLYTVTTAYIVIDLKGPSYDPGVLAIYAKKSKEKYTSKEH